MKKWFKKTVAVVLTAAMAMTVGIPAFAADSEVELAATKAQANEKIAEFMMDSDSFLAALNQVSAQEVSSSTWNLRERQEVRELTLDNGITITNTRTITKTTENSKNIEDEFGFQYAGIPGALGSIVAEYEYYYETIDGPNQMKTMLVDAGGYAKNLDTNYYRFTDADGHFDGASSYNETASVDFYMQFFTSTLLGWEDIEYTHTCTFDKYGSYTMQWLG